MILNISEQIQPIGMDSASDRNIELFNHLLQITSHDLIWVFSAEWDELIFLAGEYEELWGRSRDTLEDNPRDFLNSIHPDDKEAVTDAMDRMSAGEPVDIEYRVIPTDEAHRWMWAHGEPIRDETGETIRVAGFVRDITQRKEIKRELGQYQSIIETVPDGVYVLDADFRFAFVNDQLAEMTGYEREDLLGSHASLIFDQESLEDGQGVRKHLRTGDKQFGELEAEVETASNERISCEIRGHLLGEPGEAECRGTAGIIRDITDRKERERELQARLTAMESSIDGMAIIDENDEYVYVNQAQADIYRYDDPEAFLGETWQMCYDEDELTRFEEEVMPTLLEEGAWRGEAVGTRKDGSRFPQELSLSTTGDERVICAVRDISERKQHEQTLQRQNDRLEQFASVVSHDLRNPLTVAQSRLELAQTECDSDHLDDVAQAHERMETLIDDLLTLAQTGDEVNEKEAVALAGVIEGCWATVATADATLVTDTEQTIAADTSRLKQLLENLFRNAVEHAGDDVTVTVGALDDRDGFYVADDGPGIPDDEHEEVFDAGYSTANDGTGFGLNIVQEIAQAHDWEIHVTDSEAGGARFELTGITGTAE